MHPHQLDGYLHPFESLDELMWNIGDAVGKLTPHKSEKFYTNYLLQSRNLFGVRAETPRYKTEIKSNFLGCELKAFSYIWNL